MKDHHPLVAIGIPAYNRSEGLKRTLNALCNQSYLNLHIYVSDDCSPNLQVAEVAQSFCNQDKRVHFIRQENNLGIIRNHQFLLSKFPTEAKYVMWACDVGR